MDEFSSTVIDQTKLLSEASSVLLSLLTNVRGFLGELSSFAESSTKRNADNMLDYRQAKHLAEKLVEYVEQVHVEIPAMAESMKESEAMMKAYRGKLDAMQQQLDETTILMSEAKKRDEGRSNDAVAQSSFTAAMGSVLGTMMWKTSKTEDVINTFIEEGMILDFLVMSTVTIKCFIESYQEELPSNDTHEFKFVMAILGTNINISAQKSGRDFVLSDNVGIDFIQQMLSYLPMIRMPAGRLLKRMFLIFLYNISITKQGASLIESSPDGLSSILDCLGSEYTAEIQSIGLTLMIALLDENPTREFCQKVIKLISRDDFERLMNHDDASLKFLCEKFNDKIVNITTPMCV